MKALERIRRVETAGFTISFIGTLPFGVLNILAFSIALNESVLNAIFFSIGVVIVELIYVYFCLKFTSRLVGKSLIQKWIQPLILLIILAFALNCWFSSFSQQETVQRMYPSIPRFLLGIGLSAINALQIPFWLGWNAFLQERDLLKNNSKSIIHYLFGVGLGTFIGLMIFVGTALFVDNGTEIPSKQIDFWLAMILFATFGFMCFQMISKKHKSSVDY